MDPARGPRARAPRRGSRPPPRAGRACPGILDLERELVSDRYEILRHGEGGAPTGLLCGAVRFAHPAAGNLIEILPSTIHVEASGSPRLEWMQSTLRLIASEACELRPGGETVITRLGDILVIQAIRAWMESDPAAQRGWLGALQDPQIGRAISSVHRDPARDWTVASLANELAMSRSAFAARFTELVGEPVISYVARWRMQVAVAALKRRAPPSASSPTGSATAPRPRSAAPSSASSASRRARSGEAPASRTAPSSPPPRAEISNGSRHPPDSPLPSIVRDSMWSIAAPSEASRALASRCACVSRYPPCAAASSE